jgi:hypothetical protein
LLAAAHLPPKQAAQCAQASHPRDIEQAQAARAPNNSGLVTRCNVSWCGTQWQLYSQLADEYHGFPWSLQLAVDHRAYGLPDERADPAERPGRQPRAVTGKARSADWFDTLAKYH